MGGQRREPLQRLAFDEADEGQGEAEIIGGQDHPGGTVAAGRDPLAEPRPALQPHGLAEEADLLFGPEGV